MNYGETSNTILDEETRREMRIIQIKLLDHLDAICKKHHITYWLDFATLLGAYRYTTFMPVDDDIDVTIIGGDYKKFLAIAQAELPSTIFLQTNETDKTYTEGFAKLRDLNSTFIAQTKVPGSYFGIYIDIFPSYEYPKLPSQIFKGLLYVTGHSWANAYYVVKKNVLLNKLVYFFCKIIWILLSPFKARLYGQTPEDNWYYYAIPEQILFPLKEIEFEGKKYPAPAEPYKYLIKMYGKRCMEDMPMGEQIRRIHSAKIYPHLSYTDYVKLHKK